MAARYNGWVKVNSDAKALSLKSPAATGIEIEIQRGIFIQITTPIHRTVFHKPKPLADPSVLGFLSFICVHRRASAAIMLFRNRTGTP